MEKRRCLLHLFCLLLVHTCLAVEETVYIKPSTGAFDRQLRAALENQSVSRIVFTSDYDVGGQFADLGGLSKDSIQIKRNVTLTGVPGQQPLLNFNFQLAVVELCSTCTLKIMDMAITNDRRGANAQIDFLLGQGDSVLNLTNVLRRRLSCTHIEPALKLVAKTRRSPHFAARNGSTQQIYRADDVTFRGKEYAQTLHLLDYSVEFPRHYSGGYSVVLYNVYRMCENFVDSACLDGDDADVCVSEHMGQLLAGQGKSTSVGATGLSAGAVAGTAVAAAVAAALLAAGLVVVMRRRCRAMRQLSHSESNTKDPEQGFKESKYPRSAATSNTDLGTSSQCMVTPGVTRCDAKGTYDSTYNSTPSNAEPGASAICSACDLHFGVLLGSGSFGRVYRGRWADKDVAVKVIEHDSRMAEAVANEVTLMLSCNNPNVVRAYHYVTHVPTSRSSRLAGAADSGDYASSASQQQQGSLQPQLSSSSSSNNAHSASGSSRARNIARGAVGALLSLLTTPQADTPTQQQLHDSSSRGADQLQCSDQHARSQQLSQQQAGMKSGVLGHVLPVAQPRGSGFAGSGERPSGPLGAHDDGEWHTENVKTWLIQEYCDSGTLSKLSNSWAPSNEDDAQMLKRLMLLQDVARGLSYLHGRNVVHGDLNARNVLVTSDPSSPMGYSAKLADLGLSRTIKQHATHHTTCTVGTMSHMPPELLRYGRMSPAVDVYSLGIMMWELFAREVAFRELHYGQFFETVVLHDLRPKQLASMPDDYKLLMEQCWSRDPAERPSSKTVLDCIALMISDRQRCLGLPVTALPEPEP